MSFNVDELNYLIYRYLQESGFGYSAYAFSAESELTSSTINGSRVPVAALLRIIQKGLYFTEALFGADENGDPRNNEPMTLFEAVSKYLPQNSQSKIDSSNNNSPSNTPPKKEIIVKPSKYTLPAPSRIMTRAARLSMEKKLNEAKNDPNQSSSPTSVIKTIGKPPLPLTSISSNVPRSASTSPRQAQRPESLEPNTRPLANPKSGKTPPRSTENQDHLLNHKSV